MTSTMLTTATSVRPADVAGVTDGLVTDSDDNSVSADELEAKTPHAAAVKRSLDLHDEPEPDQGQGSKKRRKQSKPVRIAALARTTDRDSEDEQETVEGGKSDDAYERPASATHEETPSRCPLVMDILLPKDNNLMYQLDKDNAQSQFQYHKQIKDTDSLNIQTEVPIYSNVSKSASTSPIDVVVGSWMSELQSKAEESLHGTKPPTVSPGAVSEASSPYNDRAPLLPGYLPLAPPPFLVSVLSQGNGHNPAGMMPQQTHSQTPIRIFNPDAYCELCNKEFCNKYFLKTHKANKHGIYVDSPSYPVSGTPLPGSPYAASFIATAMTTPPLLILPPTNQIHPKKTSNLQATQSIDQEGSSIMDGAMRATCDICQKKFCNKYFVRRHKIKMHGVVDEGLDSGGNESPTPEYTMKLNCDEPGSISAGSDAGSNVVDSIKKEIYDIELVRSNAQDKDSISQTEGKQSPDDFGVEAGEEPKIKKEDQHWNQNGLSITLTSAQVPNEGEFTADRLRRLGVINVDAFCEICCKEYCNKYFLRTHKMKRHGILISDGDGKDGRMHGNESGLWSSQTSPLNLIVGEQGTNSSDSGGKIRTEMLDSEDPECDICGRRFQSAYLMQMHRTYLHSEEKSIEPLKGDVDMQEHEAGNNQEQLVTNAGILNNNSETNTDGSKTNVSADLQKLQTMILQLNNLNMSKVTTCTICNKDLEHCYFLRAHMMTEHGVLIEENNGFNGEKHHSSGDNSPSASPTPLSPAQTFCYICKKDYFAKYFLKQHMDEFHGLPVSTSVTTTISVASDQVKEEFDAVEPPEKVPNQIFSPMPSDKRVSLTPTSSYCEICNKELCNKYFMKTHMQRMHGIEIENGAQIGGVICDICNKELCSKYFLRVHKQNTHGIVEDGNARDSSGINNNGPSLNTPPSENDQALKPSELGDLSNRYFTHFTEVCPFCSRRFRSSKWLKAHLMNDHGEAGIGKWKELELQYHLQQPKQLNSKPSGGFNNVQTGSESNHSPTLKIPSNWSNQEQNHDSADQTGEARSQQVFSSLFGSGESTCKSYDCSYCSFSTPVLAFLFVHERSHTGLSSQTIPDPSKPFQCPVCLQSFLQMDLLQHHIMTHQFSGLLNPFLNPTSGSLPYQQAPSTPQVVGNKSIEESSECQPSGELKESQADVDLDTTAVVERDASSTPGSKNKFRCSRCFQRFRSRDLCLIHVQTKHGPKCNDPPASPAPEMANTLNTSQGMHKCMWCNFSSPHSVIVKKHIRKEHRVASSQHEIRYDPDADSLLDMSDTGLITDEVKKKLQDAARQSQIPASYAVPQRHPPSSSRFIMQPFLLEEPKTARDAKLQLVPSLVFLPVKEKLAEPLTVSFTLTPA